MNPKPQMSYLLLIVAISCLGIAGCQKGTQTQEPEALLEVTIAQVEQKDVQLFGEYTGFTKASEEVTVPARVKGFLEQMLFTEGQIVQKGVDKLYVIEQREYKALLDIAEAKMQRADSEMQLQSRNFARSEKLVTDGTISEEEYDTQRNAYQKSITDYNYSKAEHDDAKLKFEYTEIYAPISGKINRTRVDVGNLVGGVLDTELTTIRNMDPIHVYFQISDVDFNRFHSMILNNLKKEGKVDHNSQWHSQIRMGFLDKDSSGFVTENNEGYPYEGEINYADNTIDQNTGMITLRAVIPNPDYKIFPGQICRIKSSIDTVSGALLVHERAVGIDLESHYLMIVGKDNKIERRNVELGDLVEDNMYIITKGLQPGETYVVDGLLQVRVGSPVKTTPFKKTGPEAEKSDPEETQPEKPVDAEA